VSLKRFSDKELAALERSLAEGQKATGVKYSLADVRAEIQCRRPRTFDPRKLAATILEQAKVSPNGYTTYGRVWTAMTNSAGWAGNSTQSKMGKELANVLSYCHQNKLPILTTLVVRQTDGTLSAKAIERICEECEALGLDIGRDRAAFVAVQVEASRQIAAEQLPVA
jgi:hypothetical protein